MKRAPIFTTLLITFLVTVASPAAVRRTPVPQPKDLTADFVRAGIHIDQLQVFELGGIVLIRGRAYAKSEAEAAGLYAQSIGYNRVANLVQIIAPPDDNAIEKSAEYQLSIYRPLEGCRFTVDSNLGVVRVAGTVQHDLQRDMAMQIVRNIDGVREVRAEALVRE